MSLHSQHESEEALVNAELEAIAQAVLMSPGSTWCESGADDVSVALTICASEQENALVRKARVRDWFSAVERLTRKKVLAELEAKAKQATAKRRP